MKEKIKIPWCFRTSECTQEQWDVIRPYRDEGDENIDDYGYAYIGVNSDGKAKLSNNPENEFNNNIYTPSELVRLIQGNERPNFDNDKWYKTADTAYPWYVKRKFLNNGLDSFIEYINDTVYSNRSTNLGKEGTYKYEELTDLSVIQEYLPDGHVDKVKPASAIIDNEPTTKIILPPRLSYAQRNALPEPIQTGFMIEFAEDNKTYVFGNDMWNLVEPTTQWTANNWYVKVSSQKEANEVIEAATKMYNSGNSQHRGYTPDWNYISFDNTYNAYSYYNVDHLPENTRERPISDFIEEMSTTSSNNSPNHPDDKMQCDQYSIQLVPFGFESTTIKGTIYQNTVTSSESHLPNLITKAKSNLLDTKVNTIQSISINLQQKPKTIKF